MQLGDLIKPIDQCSNEELLERLRKVRHNREVARPVAVAKATKAAKKTSVKKISALDKLVAGMSESDRAKLIEMLGETDDNSNSAG
jgi:hypothetical protein